MIAFKAVLHLLTKKTLVQPGEAEALRTLGAFEGRDAVCRPECRFVPLFRQPRERPTSHTTTKIRINSIDFSLSRGRIEVIFRQRSGKSTSIGSFG
jgi:hypothetical protein